TLLHSTLALNTVTSGTGATPEGTDGGAVYNLALTPQQVGGAAGSGLFLGNSILAASALPAGAAGLFNSTIPALTPPTRGIPGTAKTVVMSTGGFGAGTVNSTVFIVTDPHLGPLQANGGRTFTHAIAAGSSAANAGDPNAPGLAAVTTDQRDSPRVSGDAVDI